MMVVKIRPQLILSMDVSLFYEEDTWTKVQSTILTWIQK